MNLLNVLILLLCTVMLSWFAVAKLIKLLWQHQIVDSPNERTLHQGQIPRGGGLVIVIALLLALLVASIASKQYLFFLCLALFVSAWAGLSWYDDRVNASPKLRFLCQSLFACVAVVGFGYVDAIQISEQITLSLGLFGAVITVISMVWLANLYNFMDGMDGLAASQTIVAAITLACWFYNANAPILSSVCLVLAASSYGFLLWNWSPAKIFMGDVGSITIGAWFAVLAVIGVNYYAMPVFSFVILLAVFVLDASVTLLRRIYQREPFWLPHRTHYYQRLAALDFAHPKIVLVMLCLMVVCSLLASISLQYHDIIWFCVVLVAILLLGAMMVVNCLERIKSNHQPKL